MTNRDRDIIRSFDGRDVFIYAYVASDDSVIYVGRTGNPAVRHKGHRAQSCWWSPDLTFAVVDVVSGWTAAVDRERKAIRDLCPMANVQLNSREDDGYPEYAGQVLTRSEEKAAALRLLKGGAA